MTVDSETTDTTILETADTTIFEQRDTTTFDTLHGDDHIEVIETNKTIAADLTSTNSRLNSELSFIDIWDAALTNVYGVEKRDAGSKDEQETLSKKLDSESVGTTANSNEPTESLQNQSDQHTSGKVIETKSHTDCKENEPSALTGATYIDEQIKQRHASSTKNSECERDKPTAASADNRSSGDVVPREKADREVRLIQSLKELCSVVFAKNGKVKKAKSDVQQKEFNQKGAYGRPKELENDSGIAISDLSQDSGREINKVINNNPDSLGEHASQREGIQYNVEMKSSSTEELVLLKRVPTEEVDKKRIRDNAGSPNKDNRSNTDTGDEKDARTSSSKGTKDDLSGDDHSSDTHFLIQISNSDDDIDCDLDINDAYDMYMVHEAERNRSVNEEGTCHMINNAQQDILNREETGVNASNSQRNTDTVTDNCLTNDTKEVKDTVNANVQNTIHEIHAPKKVMTGPSDILIHEAKQINNIKKQINDLKQNLKEKPSSTVDEVNQTSVKHISADLAEDIVKHVAYLEKGGTDTLEHMVPKKMTANLVVPLPFRSQFLLDNCSVKTFKTHPKDKSKLTVELEIDYRIDTAKYNKDQMQQQNSGEIYTNGIVMKQTDIEALHFGLGARPKLATNMHQHLNQHGMFHCFIYSPSTSLDIKQLLHDYT